MQNLIINTNVGAPTGQPAVAESITAYYTAGQVITQTLLLNPAGSANSQYASPVGFSQITINPSSAVVLTASRGTNTQYINQIVSQLTVIDDTVDTFQITNNSSLQVTVSLTYSVNISGPSPQYGIVTSVNGMTGAVSLTAQNITGLAVVAKTGSYHDLVNAPNLALVATTGSYNDLLNKPPVTAAPVNADWNASSGLAQIFNKPVLASVATSGLYSDLRGAPTLATVAYTGAFADLVGTPGLSVVGQTGQYADILGRPVFAAVATSGSYNDLNHRPALAAVATSGSYADLSHTPSLAAVAYSGSYTDLISAPAFARVATSGLYSDLSGVPAPYVLPIAGYNTLGGMQVGNGLQVNTQSGAVSVVVASGTAFGGVKIGPGINVADDGTISIPALARVALTGQYNDLIGIPIFAQVAYSGSYLDLTNKPSIPAAQVNSDWNSVSGVARILNRPTLATVATTGLYTDLIGAPAPYTLPAATITTIGGVKPGQGLSVASDGTLNATYGTAYTLPPASTTSLGGVIVPLSGQLTVDGSGNIRANVSTAANIISNASEGLVGVNEMWNAALWVNLGSSLTGTITLDCSAGMRFYGTMTGNVTISVTNIKNGQTVELALYQDSVGGHTITWDSRQKWINGTPTPSATANSNAIVATIEGSWSPSTILISSGGPMA